MTQERWAEAVGVSVDSIRVYENGSVIPTDETVRAMSEISGLAPLSYWHLCNKSALASETLPEVERLPLPQAVVQLLAAIQTFEQRHHADALLIISADGHVDAEEEPRFKECVRDLHPLIQAAMQIDYAEGTP